MSSLPHWWDEIGTIEQLPDPETIGHTQLLWSLLPHINGNQRAYYMVDTGSRILNDYANSPDELFRASQEYSNDGCDVYVQLNPSERVDVKRTSAKDITHWSWFLIDVDPVDEQYKPGLLLDDAIMKLQMEVGLVLHPTIVYSGRGVQAWFRLTDIPLYDGDEMHITDGRVTRFIARRSMGWWLKHLSDRCGQVAGCKIDMSVSDLPRVMRMPGTINQATGRRAMIVRAGLPEKELANRLVDYVPLDYLSLPTPAEKTGGIAWQDAMGRLTQTARDYINRGKAEPGRHRDAWHTAMTLREAGCDKDEARKALFWGDMISRPPLEEDPGPGELDKILSQVYLDTEA